MHVHVNLAAAQNCRRPGARAVRKSGVDGSVGGPTCTRESRIVGVTFVEVVEHLLDQSSTIVETAEDGADVGSADCCGSLLAGFLTWLLIVVMLLQANCPSPQECAKQHQDCKTTLSPRTLLGHAIPLRSLQTKTATAGRCVRDTTNWRLSNTVWTARPAAAGD